MSPPTPRVVPLDRQHWDESVLDALRHIVPVDTVDQYRSSAPDAPHPPNVFTTLVRNPRLARSYFDHHGQVVRAADLDPRIREIILLRVAWRTRSPYQWAQHERIATRAGITDDQLASLASEAAEGAWSLSEGAYIDAVDQLVDQQEITDQTWQRLADQLDSAQLIELVMIVGFHVTTAMLLRTLKTQLDPDLDTPRWARP